MENKNFKQLYYEKHAYALQKSNVLNQLFIKIQNIIF